MSRRAWCWLAAVLLSAGCGEATVAREELLSDPGPVDAPFDGALFFDGVDDYASVGTAQFPQIEQAQTLSLWLAPEPADGLEVLFTLRRGDHSGIALALEDGVPLAYNVYGPRDLVRATEPASPGRWQHLALVLQGESSRLYLDGAEIASGRGAATNRTPVVAFIGGLSGSSRLYHGALDELRVYHRALSAEEVVALSRGEPLREGEPLVLDLTFDEAAGARSYDRSGLGNHAQLGEGVPSAMPARVPSGTPQSSAR